MMRTLFLLVALLVSVLGEESIAYVRLYEHQDELGDYRVLHDATPNLAMVKFDNATSSICVNHGVFVFYTEPNFNSHKDGKAGWAWTPANYCFNVESDYQISSFRRASDAYDYGQSTLNIFQYSYYGGNQQTYYHDASSLEHDKKIRSVIVSGSLPWTLYESANFEGYAICVFPANKAPGFYSDESSLGDFADGVSSVRKGCHVTDKLFPDKEDGAKGFNFGTGSSHG